MHPVPFSPIHTFSKSNQHAVDKVSIISRIKSKNLNNFSIVLKLYLPNPSKLDIKSRMNMQLEQRRQSYLRSTDAVTRFLFCRSKHYEE